MSDRYVCENCRREGSVKDLDGECESQPGWTHGRLLPIETTAEDALRKDALTRAKRHLSDARALLEAAGLRGTTINMTRFLEDEIEAASR